MSNEKCAIGAKNQADIENLEKWCGSLSKRVTKVNEKVDRIEGKLLVIMGGVIVTLLTLLGHLVFMLAKG